MTQTATRRSRSSYSGRDQRKHTRYPCAWPVKLYEIESTNGKTHRKFYPAKSRDFSQQGMKVTSLGSIERHSKALVDLGLQQLTELVRPHKAILIAGKRLLAEVVWRRLNLETGLFEMGLRFIQENERPDYESLIARAQSIP